MSEDLKVITEKLIPYECHTSIWCKSMDIMSFLSHENLVEVKSSALNIRCLGLDTRSRECFLMTAFASRIALPLEMMVRKEK
jgi:hypothetical protein